MNLQLQRGERRGGKLQRGAGREGLFGDVSSGCSCSCETVVCCFISSRAQINIFMHINNLSKKKLLSRFKATDIRMMLDVAII